MEARAKDLGEADGLRHETGELGVQRAVLVSLLVDPVAVAAGAQDACLRQRRERRLGAVIDLRTGNRKPEVLGACDLMGVKNSLRHVRDVPWRR